MANYHPLQLTVIEDPEQARAVFKACVGRIEIETHSYCNRRCGYCPNVTGDRLGPNERMMPENVSKILRDLNDIAYDGLVILNSYNEPLYDRAILERIGEIRRAAPQATIELYTNGDYLDPDYLAALAAAGLQKMHVSIHMNAADVYSDAYARRRIEEVAARVELAPVYRASRPSEFMLADLPHPAIAIEARAIDYWKHGQNRGSIIDRIKPAHRRSAPCHFPFFHFIIGFNGNVVPCCHFRADRAEHAGYVIADIARYPSIFLAYTSEAAVAWRRSVAGFDEKQGPCRTCDVAFLDGRPESLERYRQISSRYFSIA